MNIAVVFIFVIFMLGSATARAQGEPLPEAEHSTIGYRTTAEALAGLRAKPGVNIRVEQGWTIAKDTDANVIWSFPPKGHPAYPSAVKRAIVEKDGGVQIVMSVQCESSKSACDQLVRQFQELNTRVGEDMRRAQQGQQPPAPPDGAGTPHTDSN